MAKQSPSSRTKQYLEKQGIFCGTTERFVAQAGPFGRRFDLFGFIDMIAIYPDRGICGLQITSRTNMVAREKKIVEECGDAATAWLEAGGLIEIWGWEKTSLTKGARKLWRPVIWPVTLE